LDWPSGERGYRGKPERRRGVDVMHFKDGKIIRKYTFSKTTLEIDGQRIKLLAEPA
jgi:ketosteroid isomerase-like protein